MNKSTTKQLILEAGARLVHEKGFNNTGLQDILSSAGVPKGSFYFYFDSKESLGLALVDYYTGIVNDVFAKCLGDPGVEPLERLEGLFAFFEKHYARTGFRLGCPIGNLSLEMSDISERFREKLNASIDLLVSHMERCLSDARDQGSIPADIDTADAARFIFHAIEGALMHMKAAKSPEPFITCRKCVMRYLGKPAAAGADRKGRRERG